MAWLVSTSDTLFLLMAFYGLGCIGPIVPALRELLRPVLTAVMTTQFIWVMQRWVAPSLVNAARSALPYFLLAVAAALSTLTSRRAYRTFLCFVDAAMVILIGIDLLDLFLQQFGLSLFPPEYHFVVGFAIAVGVFLHARDIAEYCARFGENFAIVVGWVPEDDEDDEPRLPDLRDT